MKFSYKTLENQLVESEIGLFFELANEKYLIFSDVKNDEEYVELSASKINDENILSEIYSEEIWGKIVGIMKNIVHNEKMNLAEINILDFEQKEFLLTGTRQFKLKKEYQQNISAWYKNNKPSKISSKIDDVVTTIDSIKEKNNQNHPLKEIKEDEKSEYIGLEIFYEKIMDESKEEFVSKLNGIFDNVVNNFKKANISFTGDLMSQMSETYEENLKKVNNEKELLKKENSDLKNRIVELESIVKNQNNVINVISDGQVSLISNDGTEGEADKQYTKVA